MQIVHSSALTGALLVWLLLSQCCFANEDAEPLRARIKQATAALDHLNAVDSGDFLIRQQAAAEQAAAIFLRLMDDDMPTRLGQLPISDLEDLFDFSAFALHHLGNAGLDRSAERDFIEKLDVVTEAISSHRHLNNREINEIYNIRVQVRNFSSARDWYLRHHSASGTIPDLPDDLILPDEAPFYWAFAPTDQAWKAEVFPASQKAHVVIVAWPQCPFARELAGRIKADPALAGLLRGRNLWIVPPHARATFEQVKAWNAEFADLPMSLMHRREGWRFIEEIRVSPMIHVVKDGKTQRLDDLDESLRTLLRQEMPVEADAKRSITAPAKP